MTKLFNWDLLKINFDKHVCQYHNRDYVLSKHKTFLQCRPTYCKHTYFTWIIHISLSALVERLSSKLTQHYTYVFQMFWVCWVVKLRRIQARDLSYKDHRLVCSAVYIHLFWGQIKTCVYLMYLIVPEHTQTSNTAWWCTAIWYHQNLFSYILPLKTFLNAA